MMSPLTEGGEYHKRQKQKLIERYTW